MKIMIDSEYLEKLQKSLGVDEDGNAVVGKNLEVDGNITINTGDEGIYLVNGDSKLNFYYEGNIFYFTGFIGEKCIFDFNFSNDSIYDQQNGINYASSANLKTIFGNQPLVGEGNIDLYRHSLSISGATAGTTLNLEFLSSSNLKCDSVQDLRTLLKISGNKIEFLYGNLYQGPYTQCQLVVSADICQFTVGGTSTAINVTTVQDTVTTI